MHTINFPKTEHVTVKQNGKGVGQVVDLAFALNFLFGQVAVEEFLTPVLKELHLDTEIFFNEFWKHVDRVSLSG